MLQGEHSAILSTFIKLPFVIKIFVLCIFERFYTGFTVVLILTAVETNFVKSFMIFRENKARNLMRYQAIFNMTC